MSNTPIMPNMNINRKRQSQFELFPGASKSAPEPGKAPRLTKDLTLSPENIIVLCIIFIVTLVLLFSFGVERGKQVALTSNTQSGSNVALSAGDGVVVETPQLAETVQAVQREERVVFPVSIPREILEENESSFQPPIEKTEEQERLFTIQVASFKLEANAKKEADRLKDKGHDDAFVLPKGSYSIVCVGRFMQRNEATKFSSRLKKKYNDCLVRRL